MKTQHQYGQSTRVSERYCSYGILSDYLFNALASYYPENSSPFHVLALTFCFVSLIAHILFGLSQKHSNILLSTLRIVTSAAFTAAGVPKSSWLWKSISDLPRDIRPALDRLHIIAPTTSYICCVKCSTLYLPVEGEFPLACEAKTGTGGVCGSVLGKHVKLRGHWIHRPIKTFEYQPVDQWLGWMLSRPRMESLMMQTPRNRVRTDQARDVWDGTAIHDIIFEDGHTFTSQTSDLRLAFSIGIDWFQVFPGGEARKTWSIGAIYLVCMNLPPAIRYRQENICLLGVIPGPRKPPGTQIDHYLNVIVENLLPYWKTGVSFSRTHLSAEGRKVWAVLLLLVCDLDAARGIAGFAHHSHTYFCSWCDTTLSHIGNFDKSTWNARKWCDHRRHAEEWRRAPAEEKQKLYDKHGVRYSKLLDLGYFNVLQSVVLDVMHNMLLGNLKRHCMKVWGMDIEVKGGDGAIPLAERSASDEEMAQAQLILRTGADENGKPRKLSALGLPVLQRLCIEKAIFDKVARKRVKASLCEALEEWVSTSDIKGTTAHANFKRVSAGVNLSATPAPAPPATNNQAAPATKSTSRRPRYQVVEYTAKELRELNARLFRTPKTRWCESFNWSELHALLASRLNHGELLPPKMLKKDMVAAIMVRPLQLLYYSTY